MVRNKAITNRRGGEEIQCEYLKRYSLQRKAKCNKWKTLFRIRSWRRYGGYFKLNLLHISVFVRFNSPILLSLFSNFTLCSTILLRPSSHQPFTPLCNHWIWSNHNNLYRILHLHLSFSLFKNTKHQVKYHNHTFSSIVPNIPNILLF